MEANRLAKMCFAPERLEGRLVPEPACPRRATAASNPQTELEREPLKVGDLPRNEDDILELEAAEDLVPLKATQLRVDPVEQVGARLEWSVATQVVPFCCETKSYFVQPRSCWISEPAFSQQT